MTGHGGSGGPGAGDDGDGSAAATLGFDPVTLSVIRGRLDQLVTEMDTVLVRSAFSPIITEAYDMGNGLYRPDGRTVTQGEYSLPVFAGNMTFTVRAVADAFAGDVRPGDVYVTNDPYLGGTHLNDVKLIQPFFAADELLAFVANTAHWIDVGSAVPGTFNGETRTVFEEGVRIPPLPLYRDGSRNDAVVDLLLSNVRRREDVAGDLAAQRNALGVAEDRLGSLVDDYGAGTLVRAMDALEAASERQMRARVGGIPDGTYRFTDHLDNDGVTDEPLPVVVALTVSGSDVDVDFTGSGRPAGGPLNAPRSTTASMVNIAFKHAFPEVPINAGCFAPLSLTIPEESFLDARFPRATVGYTEAAQRILDAVMGALAQAVPDRVPAQPFSTSTVTSIGGTHRGEDYVLAYAVAGGYGADAGHDGLSHCTPPYARARMPGVEAMELAYPVRFAEKSLREDSGGPGRRRGGLGTRYEFALVGADASVSLIGDRCDFTPQGAAGGGPAAGMRWARVRDGDEWVPPLRTKAQDVPLRRGDRVRMSSPGGGGYGAPEEREPERVRRDVELGYVSPARAREDYGVVLAPEGDGYRVDRKATRERRGRMG